MNNIIKGKRIFTSTVRPNTTSIVSSTTVTADGLVGVVPDGWMLEMVVACEMVGTADIEINLGTTVGGNEISPLEFIERDKSNSFGYNYTNNKNVGGFSVYVSSPAWTTASLDIYLILRRVK
jgi:hypothetical protein